MDFDILKCRYRIAQCADVSNASSVEDNRVATEVSDTICDVLSFLGRVMPLIDSLLLLYNDLPDVDPVAVPWNGKIGRSGRPDVGISSHPALQLRRPGVILPGGKERPCTRPKENVPRARHTAREVASESRAIPLINRVSPIFLLPARAA